MSINQVLITGNLTRDSELRETQTGYSILAFGVAVNERRKNQQTGEWEDKPNFVDCKMFGSRAEKLHQYLTKGLKVAINGRLNYSSWESNGQRRSKLEVIVDNLEFMTSRNNASQSYGYSQQSSNAQAAQPAASAPTVNTSSSAYDEDIPF